MAPILITLWQWRKALMWLSIVAAIALMGWRISAWRESHIALPAIQAELAAELSCEAASKCAERAATAAREAEEKAAQAASDALAAAAAREEAAQREAAEWRRRFRAAQQENPECADWSSQPVRCPL